MVCFHALCINFRTYFGPVLAWNRFLFKFPIWRALDATEAYFANTTEITFLGEAHAFLVPAEPNFRIAIGAIWSLFAGQQVNLPHHTGVKQQCARLRDCLLFGSRDCICCNLSCTFACLAGRNFEQPLHVLIFASLEQVLIAGVYEYLIVGRGAK